MWLNRKGDAGALNQQPLTVANACLTGRLQSGLQGNATHQSESTPQCSTLLLVLVCVVVLCCTRAESALDLRILLIPQILYLSMAAGAWAWRRFRWPGARILDGQLLACGLIALTVPLICEIVARFAGFGEATELVALGMLQNLALVAAVWSDQARCKRLAALISGFLVLFSFGISTQPLTLVATGIYGACGLWWMSLQYWHRIQATQTTTKVEHCWTARGLALLVVSSAIVVSSLLLMQQLPSSTYVLQGVLPTSGGNRWSEEHARAGVGDGNAMIAAKEQPQSFGPVQSEMLLESEMPSLYDMFNDMYGEPFKPRKREKVIALPSKKMLKNHDQLAISKQSGREFSTLRRHTAQEKKSLKDRDSLAVMYVIGQTPLHLALETYDAFDDDQWRCTQEQLVEKPDHLPQPMLKMEANKPWINVATKCDYPIKAGLRSHALKIINFDSNRVPSPPHLCRVHIDRVDRTDFFHWTADEMLEMVDRERIPQLTILELRSPNLNLTALRESDFTEKLLGKHTSIQVSKDERVDRRMAKYLAIPEEYRDLCEVSDQWMEGVPRGWLQVEALAKGMRKEFTHEQAQQGADAGQSPLRRFMQTRRGPDYMFATAASIFLRAHGYPTRFVSGFYVRPERYDRSAGQSTVLPSDVHCWLEVRVDGHTWVTVEPTPGYEPPPESLPWKERCRLLANSLAAWMGQNLWGLGICLSLGGLGWVTRVTWYEWIISGLFCLWIFFLPTKRVLWTARLLEHRAAMAKQPRPNQTTTTKWYSRWLPVLKPAEAENLQQFLNLLDQELYRPTGESGKEPHSHSPGSPEQVCSRLLKILTTKRMKLLTGTVHVHCS